MKSILTYYLVWIACIFVLLPATAQSQQASYRDKVVMKNGSVIIGKILDYNPETSIKIEMASGTQLHFTSENIRRVVMHSEKQVINHFATPIKAKRIYNETQFSLLTGVSATGLSVSHNVLWQENKKFAIGAGIGIDNYYMEAARDIFPAFLHAKYYFLERSHSPYLGLKGGYGMAFKNQRENLINASGGIMLNPYAGLRIGAQGVIMNIFMGLKVQKADYEFRNSWETRTEEIFFRRLEFGTSVMF